MRSLWLHYPDDPRPWPRAASICGVGTSWLRRWWNQARHRGNSICRRANGTITGLASVLQAGAKSRAPWILETIPLYVRAGAILPRSSEQHVEEKVGPAMDDFYLSGRAMVHSCSMRMMEGLSITTRVTGWACK